MNHVAAILLAAGRSRRMGAFKPLLPFGDRTVIESCVNTLRDAGIDQIIVVVSHGARELQERLKEVSIKFAINPDPDSEMSTSISCGIKEVSAEARAVIVTPGDYPAVPPEVIRLLIDQWESGARLVQPENDGRGGHPVLIDLVYRDALLNLDPKRGLRGLFDAHCSEVTRVPVDCPFVARDMDTWEDYVRLHREVFGRPPIP